MDYDEIIEIEVRADASKVVQDFRKVSGEIDKLKAKRASVEVDVNSEEAIAEIAAIDKALAARERKRALLMDVAQRQSITLPGLETNTGNEQQARATIQRWIDRWNTLRDTITTGAKSMAASVMNFGMFVLRSFGQGLIAMAALLTVMPLLISSINALAGGFFALGSAVAPAVGALAVMPGLFAAVATSALAAQVGLFGISEAVKAGTQADEQAARAQRQFADSTDQLAAARRRLRDAEQELADARASFGREQRDASLASQEAALSEQRAVLGLEDAQERLAAARRKVSDVSYEMTRETDAFTGKVYEVAKASSTQAQQSDDLADAMLAVKEAELALTRARLARADADKKVADYEKNGQKASERIQAALRARNEAETAAATAKTAHARAERDAAGRTEQYRAAMEKLTPAGRKFVRFLDDEWMPAWARTKKRVQRELIPGIADGMRGLIPVMRPVGRVLGGIASDIGEGFSNLVERFTEGDGMKNFMTLLKSTRQVARSLGSALAGFAEGFGYIMLGATDSTESVAKGLAGAGEGFAERMRSAFEDGSMQKFIKRGLKVAKKVGGIFVNLGKGILNIGGIANEVMGKDLLDGLSKVAEGFALSTGTKEGQQNIAEWFTKIKPVFLELMDMARDTFNWFRDFAVSPDTLENLKSIRKIGEGIGKMIEAWSESEGFKRLLRFVGWLVNKFADLSKAVGPVNAILIAFAGRRVLGAVISGVAGLARNGLKNLAWAFWNTGNKAGGLSTVLSSAKTGLTSVLGNLATKIGAGGGTGMLKTLGLLASKIGIVTTAAWGMYEGFQWLNRNSPGFEQTWRDMISFVKGDISFDQMMGKDTNETTGTAQAYVQNRIDHYRKQGLRGDELRTRVNADFTRARSLGMDKDEEWSHEDQMAAINLIRNARARGGSVRRGTPYVVGERRAELFVPNRPGRIVPSLNRVATNAGGALTTADLRALLKEIAEMARPVDIDIDARSSADPTAIAKRIAWELR